MSFIKTVNYHWRQTKDKILIYIYLNPKKDIKFDILQNYLKVISKTAYLYIELFLWGEINTKESFSVLNYNEIIFSLKKIDSNIEWPTLEKINLNKKLTSQFRTQQYENLQYISELTARNKLDTNENRIKAAVRAQLILDISVNNKIEKSQMALKKQAISMLETYEKSNVYSENNYKKKRDKILRKDNIDIDSVSLKLPIGSIINVNKQISNQRDCIHTDVNNHQNSIEEHQFNFQIRKPFVISIFFTKCIFHTPARENHHIKKLEVLRNEK